MTDKKDVELDPIQARAQRIKKSKKFKAISTDDIDMSAILIALSEYINQHNEDEQLQKKKAAVLAKKTSEVQKILLLFDKGDYEAIYDIGLISSEILVEVCVNLDDSIRIFFKKIWNHKTITNAKKANGARGEKYNLIKLELKGYWTDNIPPTMKATQAAIMLERTDICIKSSTKIERSTIASYVRKWQRLPK